MAHDLLLELGRKSVQRAHESLRRRNEDPLRPAFVALEMEDALGTVELRAFEHEPDDGAGGVELAEPVSVDLIDVGLVETTEDVGVEPAERKRDQRVEHVDERFRPRSVPVVVVLVTVEPQVLLEALGERAPQHIAEVAVEQVIG